MGAQAVRLSNIDIDNALKNKDFEILFQPIFDLGNGALARVETFVRWRHPALGVLPPGAFISFFETQGRMGELTRYVLDLALTEYLDWRGPYAPGFSINLALSDLSDGAFASHFKVLTRERGFPAELVTLECPMPPTDMDMKTAGEHFQRLADTGARLAIEVRGRANDFLRNIDPFPFVEIKTGGAAILRFARTVRGPGLSAISELLELANKTNAAITAVGVEDQASLSALRGLGFAAAQGNHLGRVGQINDFTPSRVNEVRELLELAPLNKEDLAALFRTGAPDVRTNITARKAETVEKNTALRKDKASPDAGAPAAEKTPDRPQKDDLVERLAARIAQTTETGENAAAAPAHGKKPTEENRRKAAAITRARKKAATNNNSVPAHELQDRLSKEFEAFAQPAGGEDQTAAAQSELKPARQTKGKEPQTEGKEPKAGKPPGAIEKKAAKTTTSENNTVETKNSHKCQPARSGERPLPEHEPQTDTPAADPAMPDAKTETPGMDASQDAPIATADEHSENAGIEPTPTAEDAMTSKPENDTDEIGVADQAASLTAADTPREPDGFSLEIPEPTARFRPGVRIAGPEVEPIDSTEPHQALAVEAADVTGPAPAETQEAVSEPAPTAEVEQETAVAVNEDDASGSMPAPTSTPTPADPPGASDEEPSPAEDESREAAWIEETTQVEPAGRRKNFLMRKYQWPVKLWRTFFWPTHFWPKTQNTRNAKSEARVEARLAAADNQDTSN